MVYYGLLIIHDSSDLMFQLGVQLVQKVKKRYLEIIGVFYWEKDQFISS
jgi:hypothetical protein